MRLTTRFLSRITAAILQTRCCHRDERHEVRLQVEELERRVTPAALSQFVDPDPSPFDGFATAVVVLGNGNVVITAPEDSAGGTDAGAVYVFNPSGACVSALRGSHPNDLVGSGGVTALNNGGFDFVVKSPFWNGGIGAVTFGSGSTGVSGSVSDGNSLVGSTPGDNVGSGGVTALPNGNYVVDSPNWDNAGAAEAGAVTFATVQQPPGQGIADEGLTGPVTSDNSLVGTRTASFVGSGGVVAMSGNAGNFVVVSPDWSSDSAVDAGAVTWEPGNMGVGGPVSADNSLVGPSADCLVGSGGVTPLALQKNAAGAGNYVVDSPDWSNGTTPDAGAVTWGSGTTGTDGKVTVDNSLVGTMEGSLVGSGGVVALTNQSANVSSNYVVLSPAWTDGTGPDLGAATWGNGTTGVSGAVAGANSLVGTTAGSLVGAGGVAALGNGNYVVASPEWGMASLPSLGAVTWGDGAAGVDGAVTADNSVVGVSAYDLIGAGGVTPLSNSNYVIKSPYWGPSGQPNTGAITWEKGGTAAKGTVSAMDSLVGDAPGDYVGSGGVVALSNGAAADYAVVSPNWSDPNGALNVGAVTWEGGSGPATGVVSATNSLVGSTTGDFVGSGGVTALANGNYVVDSPDWNNTGAVNAGAVTWENGTGAAVTGRVSATNSLVGTSAGSFVGSGGVVALTGNTSTTLFNYLVDSPNWNKGTAVAAGAVTWGGSSGITGYVTGNNSAIGTIGTVSPKVTVTQDKFNVTFFLSFVNGADQVLIGSQQTGFAPQVNGLAPSAGPLSGGTQVTITGIGLAGATQVDFGSIPATLVSASADQVVVISPPGLPGAVPVTVSVPVSTSAGGTQMVVAAAGPFTYDPPPTVSSLTTTAGPVTGGTRVTIAGTNLTGATLVRFGSAAAAIVSDSSNQIVALSPAGTAGLVNVTVETAGGTSTTSADDQFTYVAPPAVSGISPSAGLQGVATAVTITGTDLQNATAVDFGAMPATILSDTPNELVVLSPAQGVGTAAISVTTSRGTSAPTPGAEFSYCDPAACTVSLAATSVQAGATVAVRLQSATGLSTDLSAGGLTVTFNYTAGNGSQGTLGPVAYRGDGVYSANFTQTAAGTYTILATVNGQPVATMGPVVVVHAGPPSLTRSVLSGPSRVQSGQQATVTLQALDAFGNAVTAQNLRVAFTLGVGTGHAKLGNVVAAGNGVYRASLTATLAGANTIQATIGGLRISSGLSLDITPGTYSLANSVITAASTTAKVGGTISVFLQTRDAAGNNLADDLQADGVPVVFALGSATGGQGTFSSMLYLGNGRYKATLTANRVGANTILAFIGGSEVTSRVPTIRITAGR